MKITTRDILVIAQRMLASDMPETFVRQAVTSALEDIDQGRLGVAGLMSMWAEGGPESEDCIADIYEHLDDMEGNGSEAPYIAFDDLERIAQDIVLFKGALRRHIDKHGGVTKVAQAAGIPQPSLSRMLNTASMPRRNTLYKLANAMGLTQVDVANEWAQ